MDTTKMGNIVPRAGIEPASLAFQASVLPCKLPDVTTIPMPTCDAAPCLRDQCRPPHSYP